MEPIISVNPETSGNYYAVFYLLAFIAGFVLLVWEGYKRKYPTIQWMLVIVTAFLFFIVGCRLIAFSTQEWRYVFRFEAIPYSTSRSVLGGILLSIPAILFAKKFLRFQFSMMDAFALVLPLALVIQRFGCLMAGCCFGKPTSLPWAIQYGFNSHAFTHQMRVRLLTSDSQSALPVHPVQLYEVICCLFIIALVVQLRKKIRAQGNLFLSSIGLYGVARFFLEFYRGRYEANSQWIYFTDVQLGMLVFVPLLFLMIYKREKSGVDKSCVQEVCHDFFTPAAYLLFISAVFLLVSPWLNKTEILSLNIVFVSMFVSIVWYIFKRVTVPQYRLISLALPVFALCLMSQTLPEKNSKPIDSSFSTISVGIMGGNTDLIYGDDYTDDCYDEGRRTSYSNEYDAVAIGYHYTRQRGERSMTWGLNAFKIDHTEDSYSGRVAGFPSDYRDFSGIGFNPYAQFNYTKFGFGLGFNIGEFTSIVPVTETEYSTMKHRNFYPSFSVRAGAQTKCYVEYKFANQFPTSFPALNHQLYMGFGTTRRDQVWRGGGIRIGTASNAGVFISTTTAIGETVLVETFFGGLGGAFNPYDHAHSTIGALSLHVKFGKKDVE